MRSGISTSLVIGLLLIIELSCVVEGIASDSSNHAIIPTISKHNISSLVESAVSSSAAGQAELDAS